MLCRGTRRQTPGAEALFVAAWRDPRAEALGYLEAKTAIRPTLPKRIASSLGVTKLPGRDAVGGGMGVVDDAVAAGGFGLVEGLVGTADHIFDIHIGQVHPCDAKAGGYADGVSTIGEGFIRDSLLQLNEPREGIIDGKTRKDNEELFAAVAADEVVGTHIFEHSLSGIAQDGVAGEMAEGVVDLLEVVDVGEDNGEAGTVAAGAVHLALEDLEDSGAVPDTREGVVSGLLVQGFAGGNKLALFGFEFPRPLGHKMAQLMLFFDEPAGSQPPKKASEEEGRADENEVGELRAPPRRTDGEVEGPNA
jgi:hypothetical protein